MPEVSKAFPNNFRCCLHVFNYRTGQCITILLIALNNLFKESQSHSSFLSFAWPATNVRVASYKPAGAVVVAVTLRFKVHEEHYTGKSVSVLEVKSHSLAKFVIESLGILRDTLESVDEF
jgi:hypothetical protein